MQNNFRRVEYTNNKHTLHNKLFPCFIINNLTTLKLKTNVKTTKCMKFAKTVMQYTICRNSITLGKHVVENKIHEISRTFAYCYLGLQWDDLGYVEMGRIYNLEARLRQALNVCAFSVIYISVYKTKRKILIVLIPNVYRVHR